ncbi:MAG: N-acetyltransferase, partial [Moorea sp. SIO2C4]|nr:N-acetyltransferase [Moorena sp. SIO2C4]
MLESGRSSFRDFFPTPDSRFPTPDSRLPIP